MAQIVFDESRISSYKYAQECYQAYKTDKTSVVGYDEELMEAEWSNHFTEWDNENSVNDVNEYDLGDDFSIDDLDMDDVTSEDDAQETSVNGDVQIENSKVGETKALVSSAAVADIAAGIVSSSGVSQGLKLGSTIASAAGAGTKVCVITAAVTELAISILYHASKPNKEAHEALQSLREAFDIKGLGAEIDNNNAEISNEQKELKEKQDLLQVLIGAREAIMQKVNAGETLTEEESRQLEEIGANILTLQGEVAALSEKVNVSRTKTEGISEKVLQTQENANIALELAQDTIKSETIEIVTQAINTASSAETAAVAGAIAGGLTAGVFTIGAAAPYWAAMGMAIAGGVGSSLGIAEQSKFLSQDKETSQILNGVIGYAEQANTVVEDSKTQISDIETTISGLSYPEQITDGNTAEAGEGESVVTDEVTETVNFFNQNSTIISDDSSSVQTDAKKTLFS